MNTPSRVLLTSCLLAALFAWSACADDPPPSTGTNNAQNNQNSDNNGDNSQNNAQNNENNPNNEDNNENNENNSNNENNQNNNEADAEIDIKEDPDVSDEDADADADATPDIPEDDADVPDEDADVPVPKPCDPNPCTAAPEAVCDGDGTTLLTYEAPGACAEQDGRAVCQYPEQRTDCAAQGMVCEAGECVAPPLPRPAPGELTVTEIMYNPLGVDDNLGEWVELYVSSPQPVALDGCEVRDSANNIAALDGLTADPGDVLLLVRSPDANANGGLTPWATFGFGLGNDGDAVTVVCDGELIDEVLYDAGENFPLANGASLSLSRSAYGDDNGDGARWCLGTEPYVAEPATNYGTPGALNPECTFFDPCDPDPCGEAPAPTCLDENTLITYTGAGDCADEDDQAVCTYPEARTDCTAQDRVCLQGACVLPTPPPAPGEVLITEIFYDPTALEEAQGEWVELHNTTDAPRNLSNCVLGDSSTAASRLAGVVIEPGAYLVLGRVTDPNLNGGLTPAALFTFGLNNTGDEARLQCGEVVVDRVVYDGGPQFANVPGRALSLDPVAGFDPQRNDLGSSWCAAVDAYYVNAETTTTHYGTPGGPNPACPVVDITVDHCRLERPASLELLAGVTFPMAARVTEEGITDLTDGVDLNDDLRVQLGYGPDGSTPTNAWTWLNAAPTQGWDAVAAQAPGVDEYGATVTAPAAGTWDMAARASRDGGVTWTLCDLDAGEGSDGAEDGYQVANAGALVTRSSPCEPNPCDAPYEPVCAEDGTTLLTYDNPGTCSVVNGEALCEYVEQPVDCAAEGSFCVEDACGPSFARPVEGEVVITEFMYDPLGLSDVDAEWVEVHNTTDETLSLSGCSIEDNASDSAVVIRSMLIGPGEYALLGRSDDALANGGLDVGAVFDFGLNNSGTDSVVLVCDAVEVDRVDYDVNGVFLRASGASLSLSGDALDPALNDDGLRWCLGVEVYNPSYPLTEQNLGTPGAANPLCPAVAPCEPNPCDAPPADACDVDGVTLLTYNDLGACTPEGREATCAYPPVPVDCAADGMVCARGACVPDLGTPEPAAPGEVLITEILYDPHNGLGEADAEWFELYNTTDHPITLNGCTVKDETSAPTSLTGLVIAPNDYFLLVRSANPARNGGLTPDKTFGFALGNDADTITLACDGDPIDAVRYSTTTNSDFPVGRAASIALDPIFYDAVSNNLGASWCLGVEPYYTTLDGLGDHLGTPGAPNPPCNP